MIFTNLEILNVYQINDYITSIFMFRYFNLKNLLETFANHFVTNNETRKTSTAQEKHPSSIKRIMEPIMQYTHYPTMELIFGTV